MTSTTVGLPDRYRPIEQVGPDEPTSTGVISTWRAKDRVLNRDVAIRVHTPGGPAAHSWITRALTAGGLATPALAMVYDASEGTLGPDGSGGGAYVVNEWIDGETLAERLSRSPLPDREARTVLRRLADGVAEAHRVGLAVGGLAPENVVLRPNGLVGLRGVPAAEGTVEGDITALGALLEFALTGRTSDGSAAMPGISPDLAALVRRARSTEPGQGLTSAAAMAALLAERSRPVGGRPGDARGPESDRSRRPRASEERPHPPVPAAPADPRPSAFTPPTVAVAPPGDASRWGDRGRHAEPTGLAAGPATPGYGFDEPDAHVLADGALADEAVDDLLDEPAGLEAPTTRRRLAVYGVPVLALAVVIGLAVWLGSSVLSVASNVGQVQGSTPTAQPSQSTSSSAAQPAAGKALPIVGATVFDPKGDGEPENTREVDLTHDGDPTTVWSTLNYRSSPAFGNLKPGVGVLFDLGSAQSLAGVTITTTLPGSSVEVRTGSTPTGALEAYQVAGTATLDGTTKVRFDKAANARYVLVWVTRLVSSKGEFSANLAEVTVQRAG
jgi:eukaryotic-like serine/threonine-protein kinase